MNTETEHNVETNIYSIVDEICSFPPKPPCSIQFILDHNVESEVEFDVVKTFTKACMRKLFGKNATPSDLSQEQFDLLNQYVKSIGYTLSFEIDETIDTYKYKINFDKYISPTLDKFKHLENYMAK